tara:strand:+ start:39 stop:515 length:477 start_codon:yes stop_codon:yes gene_type:complete
MNLKEKMKKKNSESSLVKKLKNSLKTELGRVYLTSDDTKFLNEYQAIIHESSLSEKQTTDRRWKEMKTKIAELVCEILKEKQWGIFFKNEPIQALPAQDNTTLYKVNEVRDDELLDAIEYSMEERINEWQNHQAEREENQTEQESSSGTKQTLDDTLK